MLTCRSLVRQFPKSCRSFSGLSYTKESPPQVEPNYAPTLFLHGVFGSKINFSKASKRLAADLKTDCYCLDCRNHGRSDWRSTMSLIDLAEDVASFSQEMGLDKVNIVGHSLGGKQACLVASLYPDLVQSAVIVDMFPVTFSSSHLDDACTALSLLPLSKLKSRDQASQLLSSQIPSELERSFILSNLVSVPGKGKGPKWRWRCNINVISEYVSDIRGYPDSTPVSNVETLFLYGGKSDYMTPARVQQSRELFSAASFKVIEDAGHIVHFEQPELFYDAVRNFFVKHGSIR